MATNKKVEEVKVPAKIRRRMLGSKLYKLDRDDKGEEKKSILGMMGRWLHV